ncbi:MAG TPA: hypothetical protein VLA43_00350, partial [Longimicrobiales bacterium]|nr:hypothetical protein [Longimicrobiales bacterium]
MTLPAWRHPAPRPAVLAAVALLCGGATAACAQTPGPGPSPLDASALLADVAVLAHDSLQGRAAGSEGGAMARRHLTARLGGMGYEVTADTFPVRRRSGDPVTGVNLLVRVPGTAHPDRWLVLTAHYDHVGVR